MSMTYVGCLNIHGCWAVKRASYFCGKSAVTRRLDLAGTACICESEDYENLPLDYDFSSCYPHPLFLIVVLKKLSKQKKWAKHRTFLLKLIKKLPSSERAQW